MLILHFCRQRQTLVNEDAPPTNSINDIPTEINLDSGPNRFQPRVNRLYYLSTFLNIHQCLTENSDGKCFLLFKASHPYIIYCPKFTTYFCRCFRVSSRQIQSYRRILQISGRSDWTRKASWNYQLLQNRICRYWRRYASCPKEWRSFLWKLDDWRQMGGKCRVITLHQAIILNNLFFRTLYKPKQCSDSQSFVIPSFLLLLSHKQTTQPQQGMKCQLMSLIQFTLIHPWVHLSSLLHRHRHSKNTLVAVLRNHLRRKHRKAGEEVSYLLRRRLYFPVGHLPHPPRHPQARVSLAKCQISFSDGSPCEFQVWHKILLYRVILDWRMHSIVLAQSIYLCYVRYGYRTVFTDCMQRFSCLDSNSRGFYRR